MTEYKSLDEAINSIDYGLCNICEAKHEFPNTKCDIIFMQIDDNEIYWSGGIN